jgi:hypothetical protein
VSEHSDAHEDTCMVERRSRSDEYDWNENGITGAEETEK